MRLATIGLILAAAGLGAPAQAQSQPGWNSTAFWAAAPAKPGERIELLKKRIDRGVARKTLGRTEAKRLRGELARIQRLAGALRARDGGTLNQTHRALIIRQLDRLAASIRWKRREGW
ncbi:MAG: hypothetical protein ACTHKR_03265 [Sphingomonas sp.]